MVRVPEDDTDCASRGRPFFLRSTEICVVWPEESLTVLEGLGVGAGLGCGGEWLGCHRTILTGIAQPSVCLR